MDKQIKQSQQSQIIDSIGTRQNTDHAILLLKAQRKLYTKAKQLKKQNNISSRSPYLLRDRHTATFHWLYLSWPHLN